LLDNPSTTPSASGFLIASLAVNVGMGGTFDYQREGNPVTGFTPLPQYRDVSNFNVGLYTQQAGLSLEETLRVAGAYASVFSGNAKPDQPYGLDPRTREFIEIGFRAGHSGVFGRAR
jgi:hypothetical protein